MTRETVDKSQFYELSWYNWVMYRPSVMDYPEEPLHLGNYLGPAIDVGPAMTTKVMQSNGKVVCHSMYQPL